MEMPGTPMKILLIEDNPGDARLIREMLADAGGQGFAIEWVSRLVEGLERLGRGGIGLVLLDLDLPDSHGLDTFIKAYAQAPHVPFVVLTGLADETLGLTAVRKGAQDYLFKDGTDPKLLLRAIRYATERKQAEIALEVERQKLYSVLNSLPVFVHLKTADHRIRFANRRFIEIFGEPGDKPCYEVVKGMSEPCEACLAFEVLKTRVPQKIEWTTPLNDRAYEVYNYPFCADNDLLVLTLGLDITERKRTEKKLRESEQNLRALASQLLTAQEHERQRIAHGLHDELGQSLLVLKLQAGHLKKNLDKDQADLRKECGDMMRQVDRLVDEVRRLSRDLSPAMVRDLGLSLAVKRTIEEFSRHYDVETDMHQVEDLKGLFPRETQIGIYRIFQESLTNIGKYAQASRLTITIKREDSYVAFMVADNGRGCNLDEVMGRDPTNRGLGLIAMQERALMMGGTLEIKSEEGKGTRITFRIPISGTLTGADSEEPETDLRKALPSPTASGRKPPGP
jgi:two-component system, NarL family, sensor histidine kinase UhpB